MKNKLIYPLTTLLLASTFFLSGCEDDDVPPEENEEEQITRVTLTFTPEGGSTVVTAVWLDVDGDGTGQPTLDEIDLLANTTYTLSMDLENTLADDEDEQDITTEIQEEDDEHMFFFSFTSDVFANPDGDGNTGSSNRNDPMNYLDSDGSNPLGLKTSWTTGDAHSGALFSVLLKHQPSLTEGGTPQKSDTSTSQTGDTDIDIEFTLNIN